MQTVSVKHVLGSVEVGLRHIEELDIEEFDKETVLAIESRLREIGRRALRMSTNCRYREVVRDGVIEYVPRFG